MRQFSIDSMQHKSLVLILIVIAYFMLMYGNGIVSWTHPDEVFYTQTAKEMLERNDWLTPYIFDEPQFEKPILFYDLLAVGIKFFGMTPFVCRFWPAFFAMLGAIVTYWMSWMLFSNKKIAFLSGLMISTSFIYMALSRAILTDMVFSVIVVISLAFFYYGYRYEGKKNVGITLSFVFSALAVLTKGLLGLCFPAGAILLFLLFRRDLKFLWCKGTLLGLLLFFAISAPWHLLMYKWYGQKFIDDYWHNVHVSRLFVAEHKKLDNWYFYIGLMFAGVMPWTIYLFSALGKMIREIRSNENGRRDQFLFILSWIISIYAFVQPAKSKLASYIFPAFPAIVLIIGYYIGNALDKKEGVSGKSFKIISLVFASLLLVGVFVGIFFAKRYIDIVVSMKPVYITSTCVIVTALSIIIFVIKNKYTKVVASVAGISVILLMTLFMGRPYTEPWVSCKEISDVFKTIDKSDSVVVASKFYVRGIRFYTDRDMAVIDLNGKGFFTAHPIPFLNTEKKIRDFFRSQKVTFCVIRDQDIDTLKRILPKKSFSIKQYDDIGGKYIVKVKKL